MIPEIKIQPLDGSPQISDNCWQAVLDTLRERASEGSVVRYLEWGAGNSTLAVLELARESKTPFEIIAIDHNTGFFPVLAEALIEQASADGEATVSWRALQPYVFSRDHFRRLLADKRQLVSSPMRWIAAWGNHRIQYTEAFVPRFGFPFATIVRQLMKLGLIELAWWWWVAQGLLRRGSGANAEPFERGAEERLTAAPGAFATYFASHTTPGELTITCGKVVMRFWHLPALSNIFWHKGLLIDGSTAQLPSFVGVPLEGTFDVVLVDGRARVPCIMRVHRDHLVHSGGRLFVHDAFRAEMMEAFLRFSPTPSFIDGSNTMTNGTIRCPEEYGPPQMYNGDSLDTRTSRVLQELFVWKRD